MSETTTLNEQVVAVFVPSVAERVTTVVPFAKVKLPLPVPSAIPEAESEVAPVEEYPQVAEVQLSKTGSAMV